MGGYYKMENERCRHGWLVSAKQCPVCNEITILKQEIDELKKKLDESYRYAVVLNKMLGRKK
jgi:hypothetical protein